MSECRCGRDSAKDDLVATRRATELCELDALADRLGNRVDGPSSADSLAAATLLLEVMKQRWSVATGSAW